MNSTYFGKLGLLGLGCLSCTGQLPGSFRLAQQEQNFSTQLEINTKIDLLWVVDNSSSMDVSQEKLRKGFSNFASKYMQPTWDIRVAVITTDTYLAHPNFQNFIRKTIPGTMGWSSPYVSTRLNTFTNPEWNLNLVNLLTGAFDQGLTYQDIIPVWGLEWSQLLPGLHDGPIPALCFEGMPYFLRGVTQCSIRDNQTLYQDASHCINPDTSAGESSLTQCVNTVENNTVHSGAAIISTQPDHELNSEELTQWSTKLAQDFIINVTTGSAGMGSERGLGSVIQLLKDNETTSTSFFRPNSLRGIIFVSDEDDQTMEMEEEPDENFTPWSHYQCDQASLVELNGETSITGNYGYCCSEPEKHCRYGSEGTHCPSKTVGNLTYTLSICPKAELLTPVSKIKDQLDQFFTQLDGNSEALKNYFVVSIVPTDENAISSLQSSRNHDDTLAGGFKTIATDRGDRYIELANLVGNGSLSLNIAEEDYSPILDNIGRALIEKKSTFTLTRAPTSSEDMIIQLNHADGTREIISSKQYRIEGKSIILTDQELVLRFKSTDQISINYQPKTVN